MIAIARLRMLATVLAATACMVASLPATAQVPAAPADLVRINESTLSELVDAMLPLPIRGATPITREFCLITCITITVCDGEWRANIEEMTVDLRPEGIRISGRASGTYRCYDGIRFETNLDASTAQVVYEPSDNSLRLVVAASIRPCFVTPIGSVCAERRAVRIDIPTAYLRMAKLNFETTSGDSYVAMTASNIEVTMTDDYMELEGDVSVW